MLTFTLAVQAQTFMSSNGNVSFYSKAPLEDIEAHSQQMSGIIKADTREVAFSMPMKSFQFKKSLMQQHFNEKFIESDKYPKATFTGKLTDNTDLSKPGTYNVSVQGKLTIHGVTKERTIKGTVVSDGNKLQLTSDFKVKVADHNIRIPKLVFENIAEVVDVKLDMTLIKQ
jgi:polyisoprenoid-binding protein YceI